MVNVDIDVEFRGISKSYGPNEVLRNVSLSIRGGELLTLLGPSGCGKTTLLRILAGFVRPSKGEVWLGGKCINDIPASKRNVGLVFQSFALFPHMTVYANVAFGLRMHHMDKQTIERRVTDVLELVHLNEWKGAYPSQLSGGMQQRVALARVLAIQPRVLLLDEPFGAIDRRLRDEMQIEVRKLQRTLGITTLFVTHDQTEALIISDRIAVMNHGKVEQEGTPVAIYDSPENVFVARFLGTPNLIPAQVCQVLEGFAVVELGENLRLGIRATCDPNVSDVTVAVRPECIGLSTIGCQPLRDPACACPSGTFSSILWATGVVAFVANLGSRVSYEVKLNGGPLLVVETQRLDRSTMYRVGDPLLIELKGEHCTILEK